MNDLFQDMINQESTVIFINDIIMVTDTEKKHNKVVEEVLRILEKSNLSVKLEKCK